MAQRGRPLPSHPPDHLPPRKPGASPPAFGIADLLQNLPATTREELTAITNQSTLDSHLKKLQDLIEFRLGYNETNFYSSPLGFSKVITVPARAFAIYYYLSPVYFASNNNNQTYALLMLKFTDPNYGARVSLVDYNVRINGTSNGNFIFEENGTTDTGVDIKIIRGTSFQETLNSAGNYSAAVDILNYNNNPVNEETRPFPVNFTRY